MIIVEIRRSKAVPRCANEVSDEWRKFASYAPCYKPGWLREWAAGEKPFNARVPTRSGTTASASGALSCPTQLSATTSTS